MENISQQSLKLFIFTFGLFVLGLLYYWLLRESTIVSEYLGISHYNKELIIFRIDWFPSFIHQFTFVIFTWLALGRTHLWFSLLLWFVLNTLFELGQALSNEQIEYFPNFLANYFKNGTYSHGDMLALVVASFLAYVVMVKYQKKG